MTLPNITPVLLVCVALSTRLLCNGTSAESLPPAPSTSPSQVAAPGPIHAEPYATVVPVPAPAPVSDSHSSLKCVRHVMIVFGFMVAYLVEYLGPFLLMALPVHGVMDIGPAAGALAACLIATPAIHWIALQYRYPNTVITPSQWFLSLLVVLIISVLLLGLPGVFIALAGHLGDIMAALSVFVYVAGCALLLGMTLRCKTVPATVPTTDGQGRYASLAAAAGGVLYVARRPPAAGIRPVPAPESNASVADSLHPSAATIIAGVAAPAA